MDADSAETSCYQAVPPELGAREFNQSKGVLRNSSVQYQTGSPAWTPISRPIKNFQVFSGKYIVVPQFPNEDINYMACHSI